MPTLVLAVLLAAQAAAPSSSAGADPVARGGPAVSRTFSPGRGRLIRCGRPRRAGRPAVSRHLQPRSSHPLRPNPSVQPRPWSSHPLGLSLSKPERGTDGAQARYDAAMSLLLDGKLEEAARAFDALAVAPDGRPARRSRPHARRGEPRARRPRPVRAEGAGRSADAACEARGLASTAAAAPSSRSSRRSTASGPASRPASSPTPTTARLPRARPRRRRGRAHAGDPPHAPRADARGPRAGHRVGRDLGDLNGGLVAALADAETTPAVVARRSARASSRSARPSLLTRERSPSSGDVALTNSGGIWGLVTGGLTLAILEDVSDSTVQAVLLGGADAGLLAMALVARIAWR